MAPNKNAIVGWFTDYFWSKQRSQTYKKTQKQTVDNNKKKTS